MCPRRKTIPLFKIVKHAFKRISKLSLENGKAYSSTGTNDLSCLQSFGKFRITFNSLVVKYAKSMFVIGCSVSAQRKLC